MFASVQDTPWPRWARLLVVGAVLVGALAFTVGFFALCLTIGEALRG